MIEGLQEIERKLISCSSMSRTSNSTISPMTSSDSESAAATENGANGCAAGLFEDSATSAVEFAMSIVRRRCEAEEIVQEAFCRILASPNKGTSQKSNKALLFRIVRNLCIDRLRENERRVFSAIDPETLVAIGHKDGRQLEKLERSVAELLNLLQPEWREALQLKIQGGLSYEEISSVLDASHAQVRTWIFRARKQLKQELDQRGLLPEIDHE
jgi:RNA polymerase sigma factor (sigma-70 family)